MEWGAVEWGRGLVHADAGGVGEDATPRVGSARGSARMPDTCGVCALHSSAIYIHTERERERERERAFAAAGTAGCMRLATGATGSSGGPTPPTCRPARDRPCRSLEADTYPADSDTRCVERRGQYAVSRTRRYLALRLLVIAAAGAPCSALRVSSHRRGSVMSRSLVRLASS